MIDKDLNEQKVLSEYFSHARIFYCKFHVIQIFKRKFEKTSKKLYDILIKMIDADTEDAFNRLLTEFTESAKDVIIKESKTAKTALEYFNDNWRNCLNMWVKFYKYPACTHMNDTNNPIESINNVLKLFIPNAGSMFQCLSGIFRLIEYLDNQYNYNNFLESKVTKYQGSSDETVDKILQYSSKHAASILIKQYILSKENSYEINTLDDNQHELVSDSARTSIVTNCLRCNCPDFFASGMLPCRHLFYLRAKLELMIIEPSMIPTRWQRAGPTVLCHKNDEYQLALDDDEVKQDAICVVSSREYNK